MSYINWCDWHTLLASIIFNVSLLYLFVFTPKWSSSFLFTFWTIGMPCTFLQLIVSGYFFETVIFKYNSLETQGFFVVGFPLEELMYLFGILLFGVFLFEKFNPGLLSK
ncbi:MAG: lycopene cyclase domain-containing protein [Flavobacteriales bacterium]|tara:strand:- start:642 stop:968 length:327 start_codon:yes stop_codon:yes gene_type:complete